MQRALRQGLRFIVLIREDVKSLTICRFNYIQSTFVWGRFGLTCTTSHTEGKRYHTPVDAPIIKVHGDW